MSDSALPRVVADAPLADAVLRRLVGHVELLPWATTQTGADDVRAIYTFGHPSVAGPLMDRFPRLALISNYGVGVDHIDLRAAAQRGVLVGNTPGCLNGATADMAFTLLLAAARRLIEGDRYARSAAFTTYDPGYMLGREVHGTTLGIVGMGRIGIEIARRARGFSMQVLYHNRRRREDESEIGARYASLDELLRQSDYVVISAPLTDETRGLIGARELGLMRPTAILVNVARGPLVSTDALTAALAERKIYAAALDVTDPEPLPRDHPLLALDNLVIAPHLGSATEQTRERMAELSVENLLRGLRGEPLLHAIRAAD